MLSALAFKPLQFGAINRTELEGLQAYFLQQKGRKEAGKKAGESYQPVPVWMRDEPNKLIFPAFKVGQTNCKWEKGGKQCRNCRGAESYYFKIKDAEDMRPSAPPEGYRLITTPKEIVQKPPSYGYLDDHSLVYRVLRCAIKKPDEASGEEIIFPNLTILPGQGFDATA